MNLDYHLAHLKAQANTGMAPKEAHACGYCAWGRQQLKAKYQTQAGGKGKGKTATRTNHKAPKLGLAALMAHPMAIRAHYEECRARGWLEQLPPSLRGDPGLNNCPLPTR